MGSLRIIICFMVCAYVYVIASTIFISIVVKFIILKKKFDKLSETLG